MEYTINDLYLKYVNKVGETLEDDRYFQYLFEMVQAGSNTLHQTNQILHKVVDERWLNTIEESLDAINEIIEKPRRFITTTEEVVPVALAKKITADSVRHLSMNTQFIASDEDGDIQPTRVLNVTTEESYDLYENRFIYHLIQRLVTFIDKRTDVIFWSTGDEIRNTLKMESKVDDAYEEIEYKIEMKIKNRQSFAENDSDNMQVFMRIDRVRRLVMALRNSSFCSLMAGCSKVRSPIQRTNLMMKDPNYRTCYKLWQFLESYDEVGYTIEERDSALEFDEEYLIQMYTNLITNYTVFKSLLEGDPRHMEEVAAKQREVVRPKFIKQIEEEIVDDYNIPDVEVRKVIIEEVTQAQLDAEAKLEEETALRKAAEEAREDAELQLENERWQMQMQTIEIQQAAEDQVEAAKQEAALQIAEAQQAAKAKIAEAKQAAETEVAEAQQAAKAEITEAKQAAETKVAEAQQLAEKRVAEAHQAAKAEVAEAQQMAEMKVAEAQQSAEKRVAEAQQSAEKQIAETQRATQEEIEQMRREMETQIAEMQRQADQMVKEAEQKVRESQQRVRASQESVREAQQAVQEAKLREKEAQQAVREAKLREKEALKCAEKEAKARKKAEAKADENRLSNRIISALLEYRETKNAEKEEHEKEEQKNDAQ